MAVEEIDALREGINYHDYLYYVKNWPTISDIVYDWMKRNSCFYLIIAKSSSVLISP